MMNFQDDLLEALNEDSMDGLGVGRNSTTEEGTSLEDEEKNYDLINPSPLEHAIPAPKPQDIVRGDAADESFQTLVRDMIVEFVRNIDTTKVNVGFNRRGYQNKKHPRHQNEAERRAEEAEAAEEKEEEMKTLRDYAAESWDNDYKTPKDKKGMWDGYSLEDLHKAKETATGTRLKEIEFAIRAKTGWGKVDEENEDDLYQEEPKTLEEKFQEASADKSNSLKNHHILLQAARLLQHDDNVNKVLKDEAQHHLNRANDHHAKLYSLSKQLNAKVEKDISPGDHYGILVKHKL